MDEKPVVPPGREADPGGHVGDEGDRAIDETLADAASLGDATLAVAASTWLYLSPPGCAGRADCRRLRDPGRAGPRRHGRRLQGPAGQLEPPVRPEDDPGRRPRRRPKPSPLPGRGGGRRPLQHPNIVQIHQIGEDDGLPFFELEYVPGGSLDRQLDGTPLAGPAARPTGRGAGPRRRRGPPAGASSTAT